MIDLAITLVIGLLIIGFLLWLVNTYAGRFVSAKFIGLVNIVVIVCAVIWLLTLFIPMLRGLARQAGG